MSVMKVVLGVGLALIVAGVALIPLPGPGLLVLAAGVTITAVVVACRPTTGRRPRR